MNTGLLRLDNYDGVFITAPGVVPDQIEGGQSQTVAISERVGDERRRPLLIDPAGTPDWRKMVSRCRSGIDPREEEIPHLPEVWYRFGLGHNAYNHVLPPNLPSCKWAAIGNSVYSASSNHGGGVNVAFVDGHTEFIADEVDWAAWACIGTRAADE